MDNKHFDTITYNPSVCLSDLCPIFGCNLDAKLRNDDYNYRRFDYNGKKFTSLTKCSDEEIEHNKHKCEVISSE
jgi:hypothetical protein